MLYVYTTGDGKPYTAEDGTLLVVGTPPTLIDGLITDRTVADVEEIRFLADSIKAGTATEEQVQEYLSAIDKGAYTYRDLNRVEDAVRYVAERLQEFGYLPSLPIIQFWSVGDKPNEPDFARYFGNVKMIRDAITVWGSTPEAPSGVAGFDYNKANALEQILVDVDQILTQISQAWFYSGDLYLAEV
jgi:hypothetical protein